jgi:hypothetical protein
MGDRFLAILVGIAITFVLQRWAGLSWVAFGLGVFGYFAFRYIAYFMRERRYIRATIDAAKRDKNSN